LIEISRLVVVEGTSESEALLFVADVAPLCIIEVIEQLGLLAFLFVEVVQEGTSNILVEWIVVVAEFVAVVAAAVAAAAAVAMMLTNTVTPSLAIAVAVARGRGGGGQRRSRSG